MWLPNLDCEVLLLDVAADMGFNGFPSPKVFLITPTTTQLCITNLTKQKMKNRILKLAAKFYHTNDDVKFFRKI